VTCNRRSHALHSVLVDVHVQSAVAQLVENLAFDQENLDSNAVLLCLTLDKFVNFMLLSFTQ